MTSGPDIWSGLATRFARTRRALSPRTLPPQAVVVHTTGGGIIAKALKAGDEPIERALAWYSAEKSYTSGYLVGAFGEEGHDDDDDAVAGIVPDNLVALHAGVGKDRMALYAGGLAKWTRHVLAEGVLRDTGKPQPRYDDWKARWPGMESPMDILRGFQKGVNARTLSLDLLAPVPGKGHTPMQIQWTASLVADLLKRHNLAPSKLTVLRHSDLDPLARSSAAGGWDPPTGAFKSLLSWMGVPWT
ncbi:MAG: N-acetylmuramoyl-L-alanine amidase [Armatimonadetes bacterium]|nr:N-acetylmuramoyl-L-alanine amidase [Armatimonadota bacterium]